MASRFDTPFQGDGDRARRAGHQPRLARSSMTERQTQAYLLARETIRRVQRVSPLIAPAVERLRAAGSGAQARAGRRPGGASSAS